ncbi:MAG: hypothetical protein AAFY25_06165 [Pseudomonadota bacterium]
MSNKTNLILGIIGTALMMIFVLGLAHSIATGFAGLSGGLPFIIIACAVIGMALYNLWEETLGKKDK